MTEIFPIGLKFGGREINFEMDLDDSFNSDSELKGSLKGNEFPEQELVTAMFQILRPGDKAVEGGANIGLFTIVMSRLVGPRGRVTAYEPGGNNLPRLRANIALNKITNVEICPVPLWEEETEVTFYLSKDNGWNSLFANMDVCGSEQMKAVRLDLTDVRFAKLDIEGAEEKVLRRAHNLASCPYIVAEANEKALALSGCTRESLRKFMESFGFQTFLLNPNGALPVYAPLKVYIESNRLNALLLFSTFDRIAEAWPQVKI